jgi:4a-hydroxytetrahydrobiopterin dehydratase
MDLSRSRCVPCEGGTEPMNDKEARAQLKSVKGWKLEKKSISLERKFKNFKEAISFINKVGKIAEHEGHHPDIFLHDWNQVKLTLSTHAIKGLSINDFIMAAKVNKLN